MTIGHNGSNRTLASRARSARLREAEREATRLRRQDPRPVVFEAPVLSLDEAVRAGVAYQVAAEVRCVACVRSGYENPRLLKHPVSGLLDCGVTKHPKVRL